MKHTVFTIVSWQPWWRHQMETFFMLLTLCMGNSLVTGEFPSQRAVTRSFDVFFHLCLNKRLSKQSWGWWFGTPSRSLWRHRNEYTFMSPESILPMMAISMESVKITSETYSVYHCIMAAIYFCVTRVHTPDDSYFNNKHQKRVPKNKALFEM